MQSGCYRPEWSADSNFDDYLALRNFPHRTADPAIRSVTGIISALGWLSSDGSVKTPAYVTVFFNGVLVQNHFELKGQTLYIGKPFYKAYESAPIKLQAHGDKSEPLSFRNIWVRELN